MATKNLILCLIFVYLVFVIPSQCSLDICAKRTPCKCVFPNGTGVDLTPVAQGNFFKTYYYQQNSDSSEYKLSTYYFHPCADIKTNYPNKKGDTCDEPLSIYREVTLMKLQGKDTFQLNNTACNYLGNTSNAIFSNDGRSIVHMNPPSKTTILLTCAQGNDQLHITNLDEPNDIILTFYSREACFTQLESPGRSFGSTLLIIFFSFVIFYLVLGVCTKKFLMGATGIEVIPNLSFWTDLPNLIRDGWAFARSGFKLPPRGAAAASPDPNSYDSI